MGSILISSLFFYEISCGWVGIGGVVVLLVVLLRVNLSGFEGFLVFLGLVISSSVEGFADFPVLLGLVSSSLGEESKRGS